MQNFRDEQPKLRKFFRQIIKIYENHLTGSRKSAIVVLASETVEAEIKRDMTLQRVRAAENRTGNSFANGPLRAQSAAAGKTATCRHTSVVRDMPVSRKKAR